MANTALITTQGLVVDQYQDAELLDQYLPASAGTTEAQAHMITGMARAYTLTGNVNAKNMAEAMLNGLLRYCFRNLGIPATINAAAAWSPNNYTVAKNPMNQGVINYSALTTFTAGVGWIPLPVANSVHLVYDARSLNSTLNSANPYYPLASGTRYVKSKAEFVAGTGIRVTLQTAFTGNLYLMYSTRTGALMDVGQAFDAWPDWKAQPTNNFTTSGDLYLAVYQAFRAAFFAFGDAKWDTMAAAIRQQARVAFAMPDSTVYQTGIVPYMMYFSGDTPAMPAVGGYRGPAMLGFQTPSLWHSIGGAAATTAYTRNVNMLRAAQTAWPGATGQPNTGPFVPVFHITNEGQRTYGTPGTFDWAGPDPRRDWGGYQYRPMIDLLTLAARLTATDPVRITALQVVTNLLKWLAQDLTWLPMWAPSLKYFTNGLNSASALDWGAYSFVHVQEFREKLGKATALDWPLALLENPLLTPENRYANPIGGKPIDFPDRPPLGPPTTFPSYKPSIDYPDPHMTSIILSAVVKLDALLRPNGNTNGDMIIELRDLMSKGMGALDALWVRSGPMVGTFSPRPDDLEWYGVWHGEILESLLDVNAWARRTAVARPSIASQTRIWIDGMIDWAQQHNQSSQDVQHYPWKFSPNWRAGLVEAFEWSTTIFTAFNGAEQRLSLRTDARRRLTLNHVLYDADAQAYDATLHAKQNSMLSVPQWHMTARTTLFVPAGQTYLMVEDLPVGYFVAGDYVAISSGRNIFFSVINSLGVKQINLNEGVPFDLPPNAKVMPTDTAMLDPQQSSIRRTNEVMTAQATMMMIPQEDNRKLPQIAAPVTFTVGTDTREVILKKPNRRDSLTVGNTWTYGNTEVYNAGPIRALPGEDQGKRTITGTFTLMNLAAIRAHLGLINRLKGKRYAAWLPSWTADFFPYQSGVLVNRLYVKTNTHIELGVLTDPTVGVCVSLRDGRFFMARVTQAFPDGDRTTLVLDRNFPEVAKVENIKMISLMYRVRQMNDTATLRWLSDTVAETTMSFTSVFDEPK